MDFLGTIASFLQVDRFIGTMPNLKIYHLSSVMVDIKLLCDLSAVVPGEVVTPPCLLGIRLNILVILAVNFILHASAVAVIDFRSTAAKSLFSLFWLLEISNFIGPLSAAVSNNSLALILPVGLNGWVFFCIHLTQKKYEFKHLLFSSDSISLESSTSFIYPGTFLFKFLDSLALYGYSSFV